MTICLNTVWYPIFEDSKNRNTTNSIRLILPLSLSEYIINICENKSNYVLIVFMFVCLWSMVVINQQTSKIKHMNMHECQNPN